MDIAGAWNNSTSLRVLATNQLLLGAGGVGDSNASGGSSNVGEAGEMQMATDVDLMESWGYTGAAVVLALNGFFGFTLNISVIVLMCKDMQVRVAFLCYFIVTILSMIVKNSTKNSNGI